MKNRGLTFIELMMVVLMIFIIAFVLMRGKSPITIFPNYSEGDRTGVVVKISEKGILFKTWEGEMNLGAMSVNGGGLAVPEVFQFSVADKKVVEYLRASAKDARRVTVHYNQALMRSFREGETPYLIVSAN